MSNGDARFGRREFLAISSGVAGLGLAGQRPAAAQPAPAARAPTPIPLRDVSGKVAYITGASSGICLGQARAFHKAGMKVAIGYIRDDQLEAARASFTSGLDRVHFVKHDVTDRNQTRAAADYVENKFGRIHLLSANAGVGMPASVANAAYNDFDWCLAVNLVGVFNTLHECLPDLRKHGEGAHVVATSSMSGLLPVTNGGAGVYTITKFGVVGMMEGLRTELEARNEKVGVSVYVPGFVNTNIGEVDRNRTGQFAGGATEGARAPGSRAGTPEQPPQQGAGMDPLEAGERVLRGVRNNDMWIISHPEFGPGIQERNEAIMASVPTGEAQASAARMAVERTTMRNEFYARERDRQRALRKKT